MSRIIAVTCSLKDANDVISGILAEGKNTEDLMVTIPIEVDDNPKHYHSLCHDPRVKHWDFCIEGGDFNYHEKDIEFTDSQLIEEEVSEILDEEEKTDSEIDPEPVVEVEPEVEIPESEPTLISFVAEQEKSPKQEMGEKLLSPRGKDIYKFLWAFLSVYQHSPEVLPLTILWERLYNNSLNSMSAGQVNDRILKDCDKIVELGYTYVSQNIEIIAGNLWRFLKSLPDSMGKGEKFEKLVDYLLNDVNGPNSCATN